MDGQRSPLLESPPETDQTEHPESHPRGGAAIHPVAMPRSTYVAVQRSTHAAMPRSTYVAVQRSTHAALRRLTPSRTWDAILNERESRHSEDRVCPSALL